MYKRNAQGWSRHLDFMLIDILSLQLALILACKIRLNLFAYSSPLYRMIAVCLILIDSTVIVLNNTFHDVYVRGLLVEAVETVKHCFICFVIVTAFMFATQTGVDYSRIILFLTFMFHILFGYATRYLWKVAVKKFGANKKPNNNMLVVVSADTAEDIIDKLLKANPADYNLVGVITLDKTSQESVLGIPVVSDIENAPEYIVRNWVDSIYIDAPISDERVVDLMDKCTLMAIPTHYHVTNMSRGGVKRFSENIGGTTVLTTSINYATPLQLAVKRLFDIFAGLLGSLTALLIIAIVGPIIKIKSPGPVLFTQERIGKNGKRFKMFKIRSMYMDAESKKKELLSQNRIEDGMMFKLDFDPRIIGNKVLPDGTHKTGIGEFIRKTSLDEFPQFFNVLAGSMSTIGTRPPTSDEYEKYHLHHRARMSVKPGITGMWQVNGRSEITDFEKVVELDTSYIANWSLLLDLKIFFKTIGILFTRKGAM